MYTCIFQKRLDRTLLPQQAKPVPPNIHPQTAFACGGGQHHIRDKWCDTKKGRALTMRRKMTTACSRVRWQTLSHPWRRANAGEGRRARSAALCRRRQASDFRPVRAYPARQPPHPIPSTLHPSAQPQPSLLHHDTSQTLFHLDCEQIKAIRTRSSHHRPRWIASSPTTRPIPGPTMREPQQAMEAAIVAPTT